MAERQRVFFALWPPQQVAESLQGAAQEVTHAQWLSAHSVHGQRMTTASLHLTLAFIGDVDAAQLETLLAIGARLPMPALQLRVDRIAHWAHNRILWAGLAETPAPLAAHVARLRAALRETGLPFADEHDFTPHVTLMRRAPLLATTALAQPIDWRVEDWCLAASAAEAGPARYRVLHRWPTQDA